MHRTQLLIHFENKSSLTKNILEVIEKVDSRAQIKRKWERVIETLDTMETKGIDVLVDLLGGNGRVGLEHLRDIWSLRAAHNYSPTPVYFAISCDVQPPALRYEIRRTGGRFMYASDVSRCFTSELEEVQIQLDELKRSMPRWEIIEERFGADLRRVQVALRFGYKPIYVGGSDRHLAALSVLIRNNGIARSMGALRQLCEEDALFAPSGGPFAVPQLGTFKAWLFRDFPKHLQRAFDESGSGFRADKIIEHVDLGAKAMGFRIRGISRVAVR